MVSHPQTGGTALKDELGTIDCEFLHLKLDAVLPPLRTSHLA